MESQSKGYGEPDQDWPFDQAPNVAAISTRQVIDLEYPILLVTHYKDDDSWLSCAARPKTQGMDE